MYKINYHTHTVFSPDASSTPEQMLEAACNCGLDEICFTDHFECNGNDAIPEGFDPWPEFETDRYFKTIEALKKESDITVKTGIELGQATQNKAAAEKILTYPWDLVLGSLHNLRGRYDFYYLGLQGVDMRPLMKDYFEQLYELAVYGRFSVLSHLYYPVKYIYRQGQAFDMRRYGAEIEDILRVVIENGKGIEINTSALNSPYENTVPCLADIKRYRQLGGEIITVGSDCHHADAVGNGVDTAYAFLRQAGFTAVTVFERRKPIFKDI